MEQRNIKLPSKFKIKESDKKIIIYSEIKPDFFILWGNKTNFKKSSSRNFEKCFQEVEKLALELNKKPRGVYLANQIHSDKIYLIKQLKHRKNIFLNGYDGMINLTGEKIIIGIKTADCVPVFLFDKKTRIKAGLHCGWKPVNKNIIEKSIGILNKNNCVNLKAFIGPGLCRECFEVKEDFINAVEPDLKENIIYKKDKYYFDLKKTIKNKLIKSGVDKKNIYDIGMCTKHNDIFYSYRKSSKILRQVNFIL